MAEKQLINISATGAGYTDIPASTFANYVEIIEDGSGSAAGIKAKFASDNFTKVYEFQPGAEPIKLGTPNNTGSPGIAPLVGKPSRGVPVPTAAGAGYVTITEAATVYCKLESMGAATVVRVDERP